MYRAAIEAAEMLAEATDQTSDEILEEISRECCLTQAEWDALDLYINALRLTQWSRGKLKVSSG